MLPGRKPDDNNIYHQVQSVFLAVNSKFPTAAAVVVGVAELGSQRCSAEITVKD
jgi:hypothetical protein